MNLRLAGKTVLVSGGSRGIGLAIAQLFAQEECSVIIAARQQADLENAQKQVGPRSSVYAMDATDANACGKLIEALASRGGLDVLVTCVGSGASVSPGTETGEEWQRVISLNLFSATNFITAAIPLLEKSAPASIVCISSICGKEALGAPVTYSAAKAALDMAVKGLSRPLARKGIRINVVSPGNIYFPGGTWDRKLRENPEAVQNMLTTDVPMGCLGKPENIADAVAFLASPRAEFITGTNFVVDGGQTRS